jgi:hypothetical protein
MGGRKNECMDRYGWMDRCMGERMWVDGWVNEWMDGSVDQWMDGWLNGWMHGWMGGYGWMDG